MADKRSLKDIFDEPVQTAERPSLQSIFDGVSEEDAPPETAPVEQQSQSDLPTGLQQLAGAAESVKNVPVINKMMEMISGGANTAYRTGPEIGAHPLEAAQNAALSIPGGLAGLVDLAGNTAMQVASPVAHQINQALGRPDTAQPLELQQMIDSMMPKARDASGKSLTPNVDATSAFLSGALVPGLGAAKAGGSALGAGLHGLGIGAGFGAASELAGEYQQGLPMNPQAIAESAAAMGLLGAPAAAVAHKALSAGRGKGAPTEAPVTATEPIPVSREGQINYMSPEGKVASRVPDVYGELMAKLQRDQELGYAANIGEHGPYKPIPEVPQLTDAQVLQQLIDLDRTRMLSDAPGARAKEQVSSERQPIVAEESQARINRGVGENIPEGERVAPPAETGGGIVDPPPRQHSRHRRNPQPEPDGPIQPAPRATVADAQTDAVPRSLEEIFDESTAPTPVDIGQDAPTTRPDAIGAPDTMGTTTKYQYPEREDRNIYKDDGEFPDADRPVRATLRERVKNKGDRAGVFRNDEGEVVGRVRSGHELEDVINPARLSDEEIAGLLADVKKQKASTSGQKEDKREFRKTLEATLAKRRARDASGSHLDAENMPLEELHNYIAGDEINLRDPYEQDRIGKVYNRRVQESESTANSSQPNNPLRGKIERNVPEDYPVSESHQGFADGREYFWKGKGADRALYSAPMEAVFDESGYRKGARKEPSKKIAQDFRDEPGYTVSAKQRLDRQRLPENVKREYTAEAKGWLETLGKGLRDFAEGEEGHDLGQSGDAATQATEMVVKAAANVARVKEQFKVKGKAAKALEDTGRQIFGLQNDMDIVKRYDPEFHAQMIYRLGEAESMQRKAPVAGSLEERSAFAEVFDRRKDIAGMTRTEALKEIADIKDLTPQQKNFALDTIDWVNEVTSDISRRRQELREDGGFKGSKYDKFLGNLHQYWEGVGTKTPGEKVLNHIKTGMYDALVTGNWGVHGIHLYEAGIHGFAYAGGKNMFGALMSSLKDARVRKFIADYSGGAGLMKKMRFGHDLTLLEKGLKGVKSITPNMLKNNLATKGAFGALKFAEGGWLEGVKLGVLRAAMLEKVAKDMGYKSAGDLAEVLMSKPVGEKATGTALEAYGRISHGLMEMTGYSPGMFKNRNAMKRFGGGFLDVLAPFMGMRQVQSRFVYNMWAKSLNEFGRTKNPMALAPVVWTHGLLIAAGGVATVPRVLKRAIIVGVGAGAWQEVSDFFDNMRAAGVKMTGGAQGWADPRAGMVDHLQLDGIPYLMTALDGYDSLKRTLAKLHDEGADLDQKLQALSLILGAGSIGGAPSFRNMAVAKELWEEAQAGAHTEYAFEDESLPEIVSRKGMKPTYRGPVDIDFDNYKALMKYFTPWKLTVEDHHHIEQVKYAGRLRDELNRGKDTTPEAVEKWAEAKWPEYSDYAIETIKEDIGDIDDLKDVDWEGYLTRDDGTLPKQLEDALPDNYTEEQFTRAAIQYQLGRWQSEITRDIHESEKDDDNVQKKSH